LATLIVSPVAAAQESAALGTSQLRQERRFAAATVTILTLLALIVHGYHPYAEDGGPYITGIKHALAPSLYPHWFEFVAGHPRFSFFAVTIAALAKISHLNLETVLLLVHVVSYWITLFAGWHLAAQCYASRTARIGAVALLATWLTLPIAGTSILLMDPYVTARSISTPCAMLALLGLVIFLRPQSIWQDRKWQGLGLCCGALIIAATAHPLMAGYAFGSILVLACQLSEDKRLRQWGTFGLIVLAIAVAGMVQLTAPQETETYLQAEMTRSYWFLGNWTWYEQIGLFAPLVILAVGARKYSEEDKVKAALARMAILCSLTAVAVVLLFVKVDAASHRIAWLQPLRILQIAYILMTLGLGAELGQRFLKKSKARWLIVFASLAGIMFFAERQTFPASAHFELPGQQPSNPWEQAFLWIRLNTPPTALFALDSDYITKPDEDAQSFRAIAERSALPDYIKDGGDAANNPKLSLAWAGVQRAQKQLSGKSDMRRMQELKPLGVDWIVLERKASTNFPCSYANDAVKVCPLPKSTPADEVAAGPRNQQPLAQPVRLKR
jgi:hypothetical protein